jgi:restriction endonuclease Mrr
MSISGLISIKEREDALIEEAQKEGKPIKTSDLLDRVLKRFSQLTLLELQRRTPSGSLWWRGCFRFDLDRLKKKGMMRNPAKGYWKVTSPGNQTVSNLSFSASNSKIPNLKKETCALVQKVTRSIGKDQVKGRITVGSGKLIVEIGDHIKETEILSLKS